VLDVQLDFDIEDFTFKMPVLIEIEPERVNIKGNADEVDYGESIEQLVAAGLRGQLQTGSLATGQLHVELGSHPHAPPATFAERDAFKVVPTVPASLEAGAAKVNDLLDTLGGLPLKEIAHNVLGTVEGTNRLVNSKEVSGSLVELQRLLAQTNSTSIRSTGRSCRRRLQP
jgi:paraquat-inducible protein B